MWEVSAEGWLSMGGKQVWARYCMVQGRNTGAPIPSESGRSEEGGEERGRTASSHDTLLSNLASDFAQHSQPLTPCRLAALQEQAATHSQPTFTGPPQGRQGSLGVVWHFPPTSASCTHTPPTGSSDSAGAVVLVSGGLSVKRVSSVHPLTAHLHRPHLHPTQVHGGPAQPLLRVSAGQAGEEATLRCREPGLGCTHPLPLLALLLLLPAPGCVPL